MSDQELLEKAARAYGAEDSHAWSDKFAILMPGADDFVLWNPLENDGDAFRLAITLRIENHNDGYCGCARNNLTLSDLIYESNHKNRGDKIKATRRAIVRAAAAIGERL